MALTQFTMAEGETQPLLFDLKETPPGGTAATFDATGWAVTAELDDQAGTAVVIGTAIAWDTASASRVSFDPEQLGSPAGSVTLTETGSPYRLRFVVTDGNSNTRKYPREWCELIVYGDSTP